jgi:hypothetical protein
LQIHNILQEQQLFNLKGKINVGYLKEMVNYKIKMFLSYKPEGKREIDRSRMKWTDQMNGKWLCGNIIWFVD